MNKELALILEEAIDRYNELVDEDNHLWWWDVLSEIRDLTDDEEVVRVIVEIDNRASQLEAKEKAGY